jgi:hypothetical protein
VASYLVCSITTQFKSFHVEGTAQCASNFGEPGASESDTNSMVPMVWGLQTETLIHAIWDCVEIKECWDESQITVSHETQFRDFHTLVWEVFDHQGIMGLKEFMAMGWQIWQMRNRKVHEEAKMNPRLVA